MREEINRRINRFHWIYWSSSGRRQRFRFGMKPNNLRHQRGASSAEPEPAGPTHSVSWTFGNQLNIRVRFSAPPSGSDQAPGSGGIRGTAPPPHHHCGISGISGTLRTLEKVPIDGGAPSDQDQASDPGRVLSTPAVKQAPSWGRSHGPPCPETSGSALGRTRQPYRIDTSGE